MFRAWADDQNPGLDVRSRRCFCWGGLTKIILVCFKVCRFGFEFGALGSGCRVQGLLVRTLAALAVMARNLGRFRSGSLFWRPCGPGVGGKERDSAPPGTK